jgi:hypothetical protein
MSDFVSDIQSLKLTVRNAQPTMTGISVELKFTFRHGMLLNSLIYMLSIADLGGMSSLWVKINYEQNQALRIF